MNQTAEKSTQPKEENGPDKQMKECLNLVKSLQKAVTELNSEMRRRCYKDKEYWEKLFRDINKVFFMKDSLKELCATLTELAQFSVDSFEVWQRELKNKLN
jgi:hypothetical protein